ncbi:hypothetical protein [Bordetella sp. H567]|uniref:hypothetical protein n=1 Tax=Bordetella sp. H567 TaxID=1697043 RepID=UPI0011AB6722|nr:hypothetical protein [Bordetella sp. H567]
MSTRIVTGIALITFVLLLAGCQSANVQSSYDPSTDARVRISMVSKWWKVWFNRSCYPVSFDPNIDKLDTAYRWDFAPNKTVGMPPGMRSPYDEYIVRAGMPITLGIDLGGVKGYVAPINGGDVVERHLYIKDFVYMTMNPGTDYEVFLDGNGKIVVQVLTTVDGKPHTERLDLPRAPECPKYVPKKRKFDD